MVVLRAGLCPGLTAEMTELLGAHGLRTGNGRGLSSGSIVPCTVWGGTALSPHAGPIWVVRAGGQPLENISSARSTLGTHCGGWWWDVPPVSSLLGVCWTPLGGYVESELLRGSRRGLGPGRGSLQRMFEGQLVMGFQMCFRRGCGFLPLTNGQVPGTAPWARPALGGKEQMMAGGFFMCSKKLN